MLSSSLSLPNEDFGRMHKRGNPDLRRKHFKGREYSIVGYEPLKSQSKIRISSFVHPSKIFVWGALFVLFHYLFMGFRPKSLLVVIDFSYLHFHAIFDRGLKVRLFCLPQWQLCDKTRSPNRVLTPLKGTPSRIPLFNFHKVAFLRAFIVRQSPEKEGDSPHPMTRYW